jgi:hypothetical protein
MADVLAPSPPGRSGAASSRFTWLVIGGLIVFALVLRASAPGRFAWLQAAMIVFGSLVIQATPFVLIGALAAATI